MVSERFSIFLQQIAPKQLLTQLAGKLAECHNVLVAQTFIRWFIRRYQVDMQQAKEDNPQNYACFNDFFTREIRTELRPMAETPWICPVDGTISQFGRIEKGNIFQAKGRSYSVDELLADTVDALDYEQGYFATLYLSPKDYHRIHMPCRGHLLWMRHIPGELFSVNPATARGLDRLFARNERLVCCFEGDLGPFIMVLVGATIVGSITTQWHGVVTPPRSQSIQKWRYDQRDESQIILEKGAEMGRFLLGSTVIMLMPAALSLQWNISWQAGVSIKMGEAMAH